MNIKAILFDLDGTILNTLADLTDSLNAVLQSEGYETRHAEEVRTFAGEGYVVLVGRALPEKTPPAEIQRCAELFRQMYLKNMTNKTKPYDGILPVLDHLKETGIRIGVVSNKMDIATKETCIHYFGNRIDIALGDTPLRKRKPAPDNLLEAMRLLECDASETLFVGDSDIDVQAAKQANVPCAGVTWGFQSEQTLRKEGADYIIHEPGELLSLL